MSIMEWQYCHPDNKERGVDMKLVQKDNQRNGVLNTQVSRRKLLKSLSLAGIALAAAPTLALADDAKVNAAKDREAEAQAKLDKIAEESEALNIKLSKTYSDLSDVEVKISAVEEEIKRRKAEIAQRQVVLEKRMASDYKSGTASLLSLLLNSSSFSEFTSNLFYFEKITNSDKKLIDEINAQKEKLASDEQSLKNEKTQLEELQTQLKAQKEEVSKKQEEASAYLESCSVEVQEAINERDREIAAAAEERRRQQQASASASSPSQNVVIENGRGSLSGLLSAAEAVPSPGIGLCAMWVSRVFSAAGLGYPSGNANDMYYAWCTSSDRSQLQPGMIIAVSTHPFSAAGRIYGHVGIYMGNGIVRDNIGYIRSSSLDEWINFYSTVVPVRWGWVNGVALS